MLSISSIITESPLVGTRRAFEPTNNCLPSRGVGRSCSINVTFLGLLDKSYAGTMDATECGGGSPQLVPPGAFRPY